MDKIKKGLGRGLSSLIGETKIETQKLTAGHAKVLVGLENASFVASKIIEKKLSVRQAENFVKIFKNKKQKSRISKDSNIIALELSISNKIGLNVDIQNNKRNKGKISFEYKDLNHVFEHFLQ